MNQNTHSHGLGRWAAVVAFSVVTCCAATSYAQQGTLAPEPQDGVLVHRNGEVFRGKITRAGDRHIVALGGGQIIVKSSDVEACCATLDEAYRLRKQHHPADCAQDYLEMAQWCQRQGLLDAASQELVEAKLLDPAHPMIPLLERRIQASRQGVEARGPIAKAPEGRLAFSELDRVARGMPAGTMESFTQVVQPMLVNNCTATGCHGPGASDTFSLTRVSPGGPASRRMTQRNLAAVLQRIDRNNPSASPLLATPLRPHGSAKGPIFTDRQAAQYQQLVDWVYRVSQMPDMSDSSVMQASHVEREKRPHQASQAVFTDPATQADMAAEAPLADQLPAALPTPAKRHSKPQPKVVEGPLGVSSPELPIAPLDRPGVKRGAPPKEFVPADPFDPQIFNRQFFPGESAPATNLPLDAGADNTPRE